MYVYSPGNFHAELKFIHHKFYRISFLASLLEMLRQSNAVQARIRTESFLILFGCRVGTPGDGV